MSHYVAYLLKYQEIIVGVAGSIAIPKSSGIKFRLCHKE